MPTKPTGLEFAVFNDQLHIISKGDCTHKIRLWPRPIAEMRIQQDEWTRFYPDFRVISYPIPKPKRRSPANKNQLELGFDVPTTPRKNIKSKRQAYDELRKTLPPSYGFALAPFRNQQWGMLVYLSKYRRLYELIKNNAALAYILCNSPLITDAVMMRQLTLEKLVGMKQQQQLDLLGMPGTKQLVQILKKTHPSSAHPKLKGQIKLIARNNDSLKKLSHLKKINAGVLYLLTSGEAIRTKVTPKLLAEVSQDKPNNHYPAAAHLMRESIRWHEQLQPNRRFPRMQTLEALNAYHEEMVEMGTRFLAEQERQRIQANDERRMEVERKMKEPFPKPPIPGTADIVPLKTASALVEEGGLQHNCVGGYSHRVRSRKCYIYRVLNPERATLSIVRSSGNQWVISQLTASCNKNVQPATIRAIENWLGSHQLGI